MERTMRIKRVIIMAALALVLAALVVPMMGLKTRAGGSVAPPALNAAAPATIPAKALAKPSIASQKLERRTGPMLNREPFVVGGNTSPGTLNPEAMARLGFSRTPKARKTGHWPTSKKQLSG